MNTPTTARTLMTLTALGFLAGCPVVHTGETGGTAPKDCVFEGEVLADGEFVEVDCNTCSCDDGEMLCTEMDCSADDCAFAPARFASVELLECGASATGVAKCNWQLDFLKDDTFEWFYSDVVEIGSYLCDGATVFGVVSDDRSFEGTYDESLEQMAWDGVVYERVVE